jgi:hypothetical protein
MQRQSLLGAILVAPLTIAAGCYDGPGDGPDDPADDPGADSSANDDDSEDPQGSRTDPEECVETEAYFREEVWAPFMSTTCLACHNPAGEARHTDFVLQQSDVPGYVEANLATLADVARLEIDDKPLLLLKPTNEIEHGGKVQLVKGDENYDALKELIKRLEAPVHCADDNDFDEFFRDVELLDREGTVRRATFALGSRIPTDSEIAKVNLEGNAGLEEVLRDVMTEPAFATRIVEMFNDQLLTDKYLPGTRALDFIDAADFPGKDWYLALPEADQATARNRTNDAIAREPLELIRFIVENGLPYHHIVSADYTVANGYLARVYGLDLSGFTNPDDFNEWNEVRVPGIPHAGVLTTPAFLNRYPTTETNRNRNRALKTLQFFLATDVMRLGARPIDGAEIGEHNPTLNDPACTACHELLDPVAGTFADFDAIGRHRPMAWYDSMRAPGLGHLTRPPEYAERSLQWLGMQMAADSRFGRAAVQAVYTGLTGRAPLVEPTDPTQPDYAARIRAFQVQDYVFKQIAEDYVRDGHDLQTAIIGVVKSPYFRAVGATNMDAQRKLELADVGAVRLVAPDQLHRRLAAATGYSWVDETGASLLPSGRPYHMMYGGIDSDTRTTRLDTVNGVMVNIVDRMANETACLATSADFAKPRADRFLFPHVDLDDLPGEDDFEVRDNIVYLHERLLGEVLTYDDPEVERTYQLFVDVRDEGLSGIASGEYATTLVTPCQRANDPVTGEPLAQPIIEDPNYNVRAWMAVTSAMLGDFKFVWE